MKYIFWLSFRNPELNKWLGGCFIESDTAQHAIKKSHKLNINPGGEVVVTPGMPEVMVGEQLKEEGYSLHHLYETKEDMPGKIERMPV